jgi:tetratricopeptide (TPR) repeat protein
MRPDTSPRLTQALQALQSLALHAHAHEHMQAHAEAARAYLGEQAATGAERHFENALAASRRLPGVDAQVELLCELAELSASIAEQQERSAAGSDGAARQRARGHAQAAAALAANVACPGWEIKVLLRISDVFDRLGQHEQAGELQTRAMQLMANEMSALFGQATALLTSA